MNTKQIADIIIALTAKYPDKVRLSAINAAMAANKEHVGLGIQTGVNRLLSTFSVPAAFSISDRKQNVLNIIDLMQSKTPINYPRKSEFHIEDHLYELFQQGHWNSGETSKSFNTRAMLFFLGELCNEMSKTNHPDPNLLVLLNLSNDLREGKIDESNLESIFINLCSQGYFKDYAKNLDRVDLESIRHSVINSNKSFEDPEDFKSDSEIDQYSSAALISNPGAQIKEQEQDHQNFLSMDGKI